jgi:DNA-directed RNA polymerase specialized sigma24 family protein
VLTFLSELLGAVGQPIELDALVGVMAELWDVRDADALVDSDPQNAIEEAADPRPGAAAEAERRIYLERLWLEIRALPMRQRAALLLNLKDKRGCGVLSLLPLTGVATLRELAEALEMAAPDFAELWKELPLDDAAIAGRLGLARQQVINLRKSARERLARRMKKEGF